MRQPILLLLVGLLLGAPAMAQEPTNKFDITCAGAPPQAVLELPKSLASMARVLCSTIGHVVMAREPILWLVEKDLPRVITATDPMTTKPTDYVGHRAYFTEIEDLPVDEARHRRVTEAFHALVPAPANALPDQVAGYRIVSNDQRVTELYILRTRQTNSDVFQLWGITCTRLTCALNTDTLDGVPFRIVQLRPK
ncbi:hypothetical protein JCM17960_13010 [Magnetospira thiophila]